MGLGDKQDNEINVEFLFSRLRNPTQKQLEILFDNGSRLSFGRSGDSEPYQGTQLNFFWYDEVDDMNEQLKIELLRKQIEKIDNETRRETDLRIEEARIKKVKILNEIKLLENPVNKYPSLDGLFHFLDPVGYAPGYWTPNGKDRAHIMGLGTHHLEAIAQYLYDAEKLLINKLKVVRDKQNEILGERKNRRF